MLQYQRLESPHQRRPYRIHLVSHLQAKTVPPTRQHRCLTKRMSLQCQIIQCLVAKQLLGHHASLQRLVNLQNIIAGCESLSIAIAQKNYGTNNVK